MPQFGLLTHPFGNLVAVQDRQSDVDQQHVRPKGLNCLERRGTVMDGFHFVTKLSQQDRHCFGRVLIVLGQGSRKPCPAGTASQAIGRSMAATSGTTGNRTVNSLPLPTPSLCTLTFPPCISTGAAECEPDAQAALRPIERAVGLDE